MRQITLNGYRRLRKAYLDIAKEPECRLAARLAMIALRKYQLPGIFAPLAVGDEVRIKAGGYGTLRMLDGCTHNFPFNCVVQPEGRHWISRVSFQPWEIERA
jgi:hypothetical protein